MIENHCPSSLRIVNVRAEELEFHCGGEEGHVGLHFSLGSTLSTDNLKRQDYIVSWSNSEGSTTISAAEAIFKKIKDEGLAESSPLATRQEPSLSEFLEPSGG